jgi:hypothetical protein
MSAIRNTDRHKSVRNTVAQAHALHTLAEIEAVRGLDWFRCVSGKTRVYLAQQGLTELVFVEHDAVVTLTREGKNAVRRGEHKHYQFRS